MPYNLRYTCSFSNSLNELIEIEFAFLNWAGGTITQLTADTDALSIKSTVGDEDKLQPICGKEATIRMLVQQGDVVSIEDFVNDQDAFIQVTIYQDGNRAFPIFQGFVVVEDNSAPLLDPPYVIEVKATDGLGLLQGTYFLDTNGNPFSGKMSVVGWLAQILTRTGLAINLRTYFNLQNVAFDQTQNPLEQTAIDVITFNTGRQTPIGDTNPADFNTGFDDYYTVLEKIVRSFRCKLFQEAGVWHLISLWDYMNPAGFSYFEYSFGAPVSGVVPYTLVNQLKGQKMSVPIGKEQVINLWGADALKYLKLATKSVEFTFNYNQALNKILNQALDQGLPQAAQDESIPSSTIDPSYNNGVSVNLTTHAYTLADFLLLTSLAIGGSGQDIDRNNSTPLDPSNAFIRVVLDILGQEMLRFMVIKVPASGHTNFAVSSKLILDQNDILQISFSWRTRAGTGIANSRWLVLFVFLYGDDGSHWALQCIDNGTISGNPTQWKAVDSDFKNSFGTVPSCTGSIVPSTLDWSSVSINTQALPGIAFAQAPVNGRVELCFYAEGTGSEWWYKDISVTILPFLTGSYAKLQGDYNYAESNKNILKTMLETVDISDSPKRYFQGALLNNVSGSVLLAPSWFRQGYVESFRFTQLMAAIVYTNLYRIFRKIEGTCKGFLFLDPDNPPNTAKLPAGMRNVYYFVDTDFPDKAFILGSFDANLATGQWRGVFLEIRSGEGDPGLQIPDFSEFNYLFTGLN